MGGDLNLDRRGFFGTAAMTLIAAELGMFKPASAQTGSAVAAASVGDGGNQTMNLTPASPKNTTFASMKQVNAGVLNIGYAEAGPANGQPVILLHGWPFDIHAFVDVAPLLAQAGYRVIVPFQRGYGSTAFLSADTFRNCSAVGLRRRCCQPHGRAQDPEGDPRRFRYRITDGSRRGNPVA